MLSHSPPEVWPKLPNQVRPNGSSWADAFRRVDGGLITYAVTSAEVRTPEKFEWTGSEEGLDREVAEALHRIEHKFETLAVGIDVAENGNKIGIRMRVGCTDRSDTETVAADIRSLHRLGLQRIEEMNAAAESDVLYQELSRRIGLELSQQFMERMVIELVDHPDGSSDVYVQTAMSYPAVLQLLTQAVLGDFAASHEEENSDE